LKPRALQLPADLSRATEVAAFIEAACETWGLDARRAYALQLCAEEIFANIAMHGGGAATRVEITLAGDATTQRLTFTDTGPAFDPTAASLPPDTLNLEDATVGGRGLLLARRFCTGMEYVRRDGLNRLEMWFG